MKRDIIKSLKNWSISPNRVPLLIKGARQVGKSWVIREFGKSFETFIELNFEKNKLLKSAFMGDIQVHRLIEQISVYTGQPIHPGKTLLFLDEIQECPEVIAYLRYFKEELPELHVIAAGSLIEFSLNKVGMPVGRVDYLYLNPLSFGEFLTAVGREDCRALSLNEKNDPIIDQLLKDQLRTYMWLGGMPEAVQAWVTQQDVNQCQQIQDRIIATYQDDFQKYAKKNQIQFVEKIFNTIGYQLGRKFMYTRVDSDLRAAVLKEALLLLEKAGIANIFYHTSSQRPPLSAHINEKFFKVFFLDIGLVQRLLGLHYQDWILNPIKIDNIGEMTEQFVAQELIAYQSFHTKPKMFYWQHETKNSQAEIDFLISINNTIIPIEVKAGKTGRLRSLLYYLESHPQITRGVKISELEYKKENPVWQIPLYGIEHWIIGEESWTKNCK